jgi:ABC-2 type transport system ATP-binding protein
MSQPAVETRNLFKTYVRRPVVRDMTLEVSAGEVYALVGPNGAGKTTVIRLVSGLAFPSGGTVRLLGGNPHTQPEVRRRLGAVVEAPAAFYPYLTGRQNLQLQARLVGGVGEGRISTVLDMMELGPAADRRVRVYSLGMRQRLGVAAAILAEPEVLLLDEPASGMDPLSLQLVHRVLRDAAAQGTAVLLSTHHLEEVVSYCTHVGIMEAGALIDQIDLRDRGERYRARVSDAHTAVVILKMQPFVLEAATRGSEITFTLAERSSLGRVSAVLAGAGVELFELAPDVFNLRAYYYERMSARRGQQAGVAQLVEAGRL